ncbi:MAG: phosphopantetheine-binding protein [Clostridiales bacterium]|nr:phosphopantetheine-binding protein [Clostridiales bacterium]
MIFEKILRILTENEDIEASSLTPESTFEDFGMDSLDVSAVMMKIEEEFDVTVEPAEDLKSLGDVVDYLKKAGAGT